MFLFERVFEEDVKRKPSYWSPNTGAASFKDQSFFILSLYHCGVQDLMVQCFVGAQVLQQLTEIFWDLPSTTYLSSLKLPDQHMAKKNIARVKRIQLLYISTTNGSPHQRLMAIVPRVSVARPRSCRASRWAVAYCGRKERRAVDSLCSLVFGGQYFKRSVVMRVSSSFNLFEAFWRYPFDGLFPLQKVFCRLLCEKCFFGWFLWNFVGFLNVQNLFEGLLTQ